MAKKGKGEPFEEALQDLEKIIEKLEQGDMPLEKAVEAFTEGMRLVQHCHRKLEEAENKVRMLVKGQEVEWTTVPFEDVSTEKSGD